MQDDIFCILNHFHTSKGHFDPVWAPAPVDCSIPVFCSKTSRKPPQTRHSLTDCRSHAVPRNRDTSRLSRCRSCPTYFPACTRNIFQSRSGRSSKKASPARINGNNRFVFFSSCTARVQLSPDAPFHLSSLAYSLNANFLL